MRKSNPNISTTATKPETRTLTWLQQLQKRWGVQSVRQVWIILLVFACTGTTSVYIKKPIFQLLGIDTHTAWYWRTFWWIIIVLPTYQILLLLYGFVFGQFRFFLNFEKRLFRRLFLGFRRPKN